MSVIDNLKGRVAPAVKLMQAPDVAAKLQAAEAELAALQDQHGSVALDALAGGTEAAKILANLQQQIAAASANIATLKAAHRTALDRDAALLRAQRASIYKSQLSAVRKHLEARDAAAEALTVSIADAVKHWKVLFEHSAKAKAANPIGGHWPDNDGLCNLEGLRKILEHELHRQGGDPELKGRSFPGGLTDDLNNLQQPDKTPAMLGKLKANSAHIIGALTSTAPAV